VLYAALTQIAINGNELDHLVGKLLYAMRKALEVLAGNVYLSDACAHFVSLIDCAHYRGRASGVMPSGPDNLHPIR
jgi:hypothetical protein